MFLALLRNQVFLPIFGKMKRDIGVAKKALRMDEI